MLSSNLLKSSLLLVSLYSTSSLAALAQQSFTSPKAGDTIEQNNPTTIKWTPVLDYDTIGLTVCLATSDPTKPNCSPIGSTTNSAGEYKWQPDEDIGPGTAFLLMTYRDQGSIGTSANFKITEEGDEDEGGSGSGSGGGSSSSSGSSSTVAVTSSASSPTTAGSIASTTQGPATVTETVGGGNTGSAVPASGSGGPSGAAIGGGIGGAVVVILLALGAFFLIRRRSRNRGANSSRNGYQRNNGDEKDIESGAAAFGAATAASRGKRSMENKPTSVYSPPPKGVVEAQSIPLAELPAMQQEPVEMMGYPSGGQQFIMELDGREITKPGTSTVHPDIEGVGKSRHVPNFDKENVVRGDSIDGTTVDGDGERPKTSGTMGTVEASKEENRERSSEIMQTEAPTRHEEPTTPIRSAPPQIRSSIPRLPDFNFDVGKF